MSCAEVYKEYWGLKLWSLPAYLGNPAEAAISFQFVSLCLALLGGPGLSRA